MVHAGVRCMFVRGGTSKGAYFVARSGILRTAAMLMDGVVYPSR